MSGIISGRARVVFSSSEFLHLSKGGLDGKIVAYRDSWLTSSFEMQDWVTFKAKACEPVWFLSDAFFFVEFFKVVIVDYS